MMASTDSSVFETSNSTSLDERENLDSIGKRRFYDQLLKPEIWDEPLDQISRATGLTINLYTSDGRQISGPHTHSPLGKRLAESGFWGISGKGLSKDVEAVIESIATGDKICRNVLQAFGICGFPARVDGKNIGVFVIGWLPDSFVDPVSSDHIAKSTGLPPMEVWQLIRMQPPMAAEKIGLYAEMLETFSGVLLHQLKSQLIDREKTRVLRVINEAGTKLTAARTTHEIGEITLAAIRELMPASFISIRVSNSKSEMEEVASFKAERTAFEIGHSMSVTNEQTVLIPILAGGRAALGSIEIKKPHGDGDFDFSPELTALTAQVAVSLQKARLIADLEEERTALSRMNLELKNLHTMKDEFLATVSHELRTPLNSMLGWSQLLSEGVIEPEEVSDAIATIERNARIQSRLIEDLLDVSRVISGKMILHREVLDVMPVLDGAINTVMPAAEAKGQKIHIHRPNSALFTKGDPTRLQQIFWNILSNSVKFTPVNGEITVIAESVGPYFKVEIADNGRGIKKDFLPFMFDRFSQADGSLSRGYGGLGLGLAIVRHLVELHGGSVSAHSDGEGTGSRFVILLPQNVTDVELDSARDVIRDLDYGSGGGRKQLGGLRILAVDDEADSLRLIKFILEKSGAEVHAVESASLAYDEVLKWHPDLIVSDISMPDENGYDFIKRIRSLSPDDGGSTPAFALTAAAGPDASQAALEAGFQRHFPKPLDPISLLACLREFTPLH